MSDHNECGQLERKTQQETGMWPQVAWAAAIAPQVAPAVEREPQVAWVVEEHLRTLVVEQT